MAPKGRRPLSDNTILHSLQELREFVSRDILFIRGRSSRPGGLRAWLACMRREASSDQKPHYNWLCRMEQRIRDSRGTGDGSLADALDAIEAMVLGSGSEAASETAAAADALPPAKRAKADDQRQALSESQLATDSETLLSASLRAETELAIEALNLGSETSSPIGAGNAGSSRDLAATTCDEVKETPEISGLQALDFPGAVCKAGEAALLSHPACKRARPVYEHVRDTRTKLASTTYLPRKSQEPQMYMRLVYIYAEIHNFTMAVPHLRLFALAPDMLRDRCSKWFGAVELARPSGLQV